MDPGERGQGAATRAFAAAAIALAGVLFSVSPWGERADLALLDAQWHALRRFDIRLDRITVVETL